MTFKFTIKTAWRGLETNRSRAFLTLLGIIIGVGAIIAVMSIGQGAQELILSQIEGLGSKTVIVIPGREPSGPSDFAQIFSDSLKEKDLEALKRKENVPHLSQIAPIVFGGENSSYKDETYRLTLLGGSELLSKIFELYPEEGNFISEEDVKNRSDVAVIGSKVKEELFGASEALGEKIKIKNRNFRVIGVLPQKGQVSFFNFDELAVVPYTTAQQYLFGIKNFHRFLVEVDAEENIESTVRDLAQTLRHLHGISDPSKDDFFIQTQADIASRLSTVTGVLTLLLVSVATISLIVGGIGIMNIMLVSVTERTREIGLRKALGATNRDILNQFLSEAILLTGIGGILGIVFGGGISFLTSLILGKVMGISWAFAFPVQAALAGIIVSALVGLIFGIYPARKASLKDPIEALQYE